jgi:hypothetical protein
MSSAVPTPSRIELPRMRTPSPFGVVAVGQAVADQFLVHRVEGAEPAGSVGERKPTRVARSHRRGPCVALEVVQDLLGQVGIAVDPVHDLQRLARGGAAGGDALAQPAAEGGGLVDEPEGSIMALTEREASPIHVNR